MNEESLRLYVIASTLFLAFMLVIMLIILQIVILDHYAPRNVALRLQNWLLILGNGQAICTRHDRQRKAALVS